MSVGHGGTCGYWMELFMRLIFCAGAAACWVASLAVPASAVTLVNGSLTGDVLEQQSPPGWFATVFEPFVNSVDVIGGLPAEYYGIAPTNSSDGGTWVGLQRIVYEDELYFDNIFQTITDLVIGQTYRLSWETANFGLFALGAQSDNAVEALLDGVSIGTGATHAMSSEWFKELLEFTATATSQTLGFRLTYDDASYMQIDGISLVESGDGVSEVPLPASLPLLVAGLGGLGLLRRRATA